MQNNQLKQLIDTSSRIILKVGSSLLINENNNDINYHWLKNFSKEIQSLTDKKKQIMIVSSGSVALGRKQLNLVKNLSLDEKQAAAAVGQIHLSHAWKEVLKSFNLESAQILLAPDDTETRRKHLNARATLLKLLQLNVIPVINENDTVSTDEIKFGDNDRLAARVAQMCEVDLLILFSDVNGLFSEDPYKNNKYILTYNCACNGHIKGLKYLHSNGHKISHNIFMCKSYWSSSFYLIPEFWNY